MVIFHSYVNVYQRVFYKIKGHAIPNFQTHRPFVPKKIPKSPSTNFPTGTAIALKAPDNGEKNSRYMLWYHTKQGKDTIFIHGSWPRFGILELDS
jgi:hypothetical protein